MSLIKDKIEDLKKTDPVETDLKKKEPLEIGQELQIYSKLKEMDYQSSLVMKSLEAYNSRFEQLRKEQIEHLENNSTFLKEINRTTQETLSDLTKKVESLKSSNESLTEIFREVIADKITKIEERQNKTLESIEEKTKSNLFNLENKINNSVGNLEVDGIKTNKFLKIIAVAVLIVVIISSVSVIVLNAPKQESKKEVQMIENIEKTEKTKK